MAKGTENTQKKYSEMTLQEKKAYKENLQAKLSANIDKCNMALTKKGMKPRFTDEAERKKVFDYMLSDERIAMHEKVRFSKVGDIDSYSKGKEEIVKQYAPNGYSPEMVSRVIKYVAKDETDSPENKAYNAKMLTGLHRDDAAGEKARRNIQLEVCNIAAGLEVDMFTDEKNCTFENIVDYAMKNYDRIQVSVDIPFISSKFEYSSLGDGVQKVKAVQDYSTALGGAGSDAVKLAASENYLTVPSELLTENEFNIVFSDTKATGKEMHDYLSWRNFFNGNQKQLAEGATEFREKYPEGIKFSDEDFSREAIYPARGGYDARKKIMLDYCQGIQGLSNNENTANLKQYSAGITDLFNRNKVLPKEDVPAVVDLCNKLEDEYRKVGRNLPQADRDRMRELKNDLGDTYLNFKREGYLENLSADARREREALMNQLRDPDKFAELKNNISEITKDLKSTDDFYVFTNTTKFNEMRDATYALNKSMQAVKEGSIPSEKRLEEMVDMLMNVSKKADTYAEAKLESIKKEMREPENSPKQRSIHRLASAMNLKRLVNGENPHPIGKENFKEQVGVLLNDVNERFHRYDTNQPIRHDDNKTRADVEKFAEALERYIDKHPKILDNGLLAPEKVNKLKANIQSRKQKEIANPNLGAKTKKTGGLNI